MPQSTVPNRALNAINAVAPLRTLWYRTVQTHFETWLERSSQPIEDSPPAYVERAFRRYLECGILAHGFACRLLR